MKLPAFSLPNIKLDKDQKKKVILSLFMLIATIYFYFSFLLNPLRAAEAAAAIESADFTKKISEADGKMRGFNTLKAQATEAGELVAQVKAFIPNGAPIAWFPPRLRAFFDRQGLKNSVVRLRSTERPEPELSKEFTNGIWVIEIPQVDYFPLGIAIAGLENEEYLLEITDLRIAAKAETPESQYVTIEAATLLKDVSLQK
jgi:hypothetical protein